jgi:hypothetical protein
LSKRLPIMISLIFFLTAGSISSISGGCEGGPYDVQLKLTPMPQLNEEATLIASVTSIRDVDSAAVVFAADTEVVKLIRSPKAIYCKFKKNKTKNFEWTLSFKKEGITDICVSAVIYIGGAVLGNRETLVLETFKDRIARKLEPGANELPKMNLRTPAEEDSLRARMERTRKSKGKKD